MVSTMRHYVNVSLHQLVWIRLNITAAAPDVRAHNPPLPDPFRTETLRDGEQSTATQVDAERLDARVRQRWPTVDDLPTRYEHVVVAMDEELLRAMRCSV